MLENLMFSLNSTMPLFFIMLLGNILYRKQFLTDGFVSVANKFVFHVTLPVMLFNDLAGTDIRTSFDAGYVGFCAAVTMVTILVIWVLSRWLFRDKSIVGEFVQACYRSSAAILGAAFIQNIYGTSGMSGLMILGSVPLYNIFAVLILTLECPDARRTPNLWARSSAAASEKSSATRLSSPLPWGCWRVFWSFPSPPWRPRP